MRQHHELQVLLQNKQHRSSAVYNTRFSNSRYTPLGENSSRQSQSVSLKIIIKVICNKLKWKLLINFRENNRDKMVSFHLSAFLRSPRSELDLLRKFADVLIVNLFPRSYVDCFLLRHALRELLACKGSFSFYF